MKKLLILLLALMLIVPAMAEEETALYLLTDESGTPVGTAVLCGDTSTLLTTAALGNRENLQAVGAGGSIGIASARSVTGNLALLTLASPSPAEPLEMNMEGVPALCLGFDLTGAACVSSLSDTGVVPVESEFGVIFTAQQTMLPGAVLVDENGKVCGVTIAAYGEGVNRYVSAVGTAFDAVQHAASWVSGFTAGERNGALHVDWSNCGLQCDREDCVVSLFVEDEQNPYFTYYIVSEGTDADLLLTPGRSYRLWLQHAHGEAVPTMTMDNDSAVLAELPEKGTFTLYDFQTSAMYLSAVPATDVEEAENTFLPPVESLNRAALLEPDNAIFLQVRSTYQVEEQQSAMLVTSFLTPEGCNFSLEGQFLFQPELQQQDDWNVNLTDLLDDYVHYCGQLAEGEYTLRFYLDGALGAEYTFTLE